MQENWQEVNRLGRGKHRHQRLGAGALVFPTLYASTPLAMPATLHPSTLDTSCPTLRANGLVAVCSGSLPSVCPESPSAQFRTGFGHTQNELSATEPKCSQNPPKPVRHESFDRAQDKLHATETEGSPQTTTQSVRPEPFDCAQDKLRVAESKGVSVTDEKL